MLLATPTHGHSACNLIERIGRHKGYREHLPQVTVCREQPLGVVELGIAVDIEVCPLDLDIDYLRPAQNIAERQFADAIEVTVLVGRLELERCLVVGFERQLLVEDIGVAPLGL